MDSKEVVKSMGLRIATARKSLGLTQEALAEKIDVSIQTISFAETGKKAMRTENIIKLCEVLNISADYLLMGKGSANENTIHKRLEQLPQAQLIHVEAIINNCIALCRKT